MAFIVRKRCPRCHKIVGENGKCANSDCPLGRAYLTASGKDSGKATKMAESEGRN